MNSKWLRSAGAIATLLLGVALAGCAGTSNASQYEPVPATRLAPLTPVPTVPLVPTIPGRVTSAPQPTAGPSAQAPTPPSAAGIATSSVEIGGITPVPLLENTPAPGAVLTVVLPGGTPGPFGAYLTATVVAGAGAPSSPDAGSAGATPTAAGGSSSGAATSSTQTAAPALSGTPEGSATPATSATPAGTGTPGGTSTPAGSGTPGSTGTPASSGTPGSAAAPGASQTPPARATTQAGATAEAAATAESLAQPLSTVSPTQLNSPAAGARRQRTAEEQQLLDLGEQVFGTNCATCHGNGGEGNAGFPALDGNTTVTGDPQLVIQTVLSGKGLMPAFRNKLSDEEIAAVVSYIRSAWTNDAPPVTVGMVLNRNQ